MSLYDSWDHNDWPVKQTNNTLSIFLIAQNILHLQLGKQWALVQKVAEMPVDPHTTPEVPLLQL